MKELLATFKPLGESFKDRLYLIGATSTLLPFVSRQAQAEEAWRKLLAAEGNAERWERIKKEKELADYLVGPAPRLPLGIEEEVATIAVSSPALRVVGLRSPAEIKGIHWEAWAKGYFIERASIDAGDNATSEFATYKLAKLLVEHREGVATDMSKVAHFMERLHDVWRASPPGTSDAKP
jgi:hypothetical protein